MKTTLLLITLMLATTTAHAQVNKCEINGQVTYQSAPCPQEAAAVELIPAERRRPERTRVKTTEEICEESLGIHGESAVQWCIEDSARRSRGNQVERHCRQLWPDNPHMQRECLISEAEAIQWLNDRRVLMDANPNLQAALVFCQQQHTRNNLTNWSMVRGCYRRQAR